VKRRIIPSLTIINNESWITQNFQKNIYGGDPLNAVRFFSEQDADEICVSLVDYRSLEEQRKIIEGIVDITSIPLTLAASFRTIDDPSFFIRLGVDRVALTISEKNRYLILELIRNFGAQAVVGVIKYDSREVDFNHIATLQLSSELEISENLLIDVGRDGVFNGFNIDYFNKKIAKHLEKPCLIRGGVQKVDEFTKLLNNDLISGVLSSSYFSTINNGSAFLLNYVKDRV